MRPQVSAGSLDRSSPFCCEAAGPGTEHLSCGHHVSAQAIGAVRTCSDLPCRKQTGNVCLCAAVDADPPLSAWTWRVISIGVSVMSSPFSRIPHSTGPDGSLAQRLPCQAPEVCYHRIMRSAAFGKDLAVSRDIQYIDRREY